MVYILIKYQKYINFVINILRDKFNKLRNNSLIISYIYKLLTHLLKWTFVLSLTFFIIISAVKFTILFKPLYYYDIKKLNIETSSNIDKNEIKKNYDYVIDYLYAKEEVNFELPSLPSSNNGIIHFKEVKNILKKLNKILLYCTFIIFLGLIVEIRKKTYFFLKWTSLILFFFPFILSIPLLVSFDNSFTYFHKIFFNNDYWLLNSKTDPIIKMLPQTFFYHCAFFIIFIIFMWSIILNITYKKFSKINYVI